MNIPGASYLKFAGKVLIVLAAIGLAKRTSPAIASALAQVGI